MATKCAEEFRETLQSNNYIFHVHTNFTDGESSVDEYARYAHDKGFRYLVFMEHVSRENSYDFDKLISEIESARQTFAPLRIGLGVEAKLLPGGNLDVSEDILGRVALLGVACHSFPKDKALYAGSIRSALEQYASPMRVTIWLHPGMFFMRKKMSDDKMLLSLICHAVWHGVYIEYNMKYKLPEVGIWGLVPVLSQVIGTDAHSVEQLSKHIVRI